MKYNKLILLFIITILVGFQSVTIYPESSLKETETEESVATEYVVFTSFKQVKRTPEVGVTLHETARSLPGNFIITVTLITQRDLFLQHRSLII